MGVPAPPARAAPAAGPVGRRGGAVLVTRCWPLLLGNVVEWYEFAVYGFLAAQIEANFFGGSPLLTWLVFSLTFISRPLGGAALGWVADRWGRRVAVNMSIVGMLAATVGQGMLPTRRGCGPVLGGAGVALLLMCRCMQGLSAGGEISGVITYMVESAPTERLGVVIALVPLTGSVGFLLANGVVQQFTYLLGNEGMLDWGWRLPFIVALLPGLVSVWGRRRFPESELFLEEMRLRKGGVRSPATPGSTPPSFDAEAATPAGVPDVAAPGAPDERIATCGAVGCGAMLAETAGFFRIYWRAVLVAMGVVAAHSVMVYVANMWCVSFLIEHGMPASSALTASLLGKALTLCVVLPAGWLSDTFGVGMMAVVSGLVTMLVGLPTWTVMSADPSGVAAVLGISVCYVVPFLFSSPFFFCAELFPTSSRGLGLGIAWNIGVGLFGGFGGVVAQATLHLGPSGPGVMISASGLITASAALLARHWERRGLMRLTHLRSAPYWGPAPLVLATECWGAKGCPGAKARPVAGARSGAPIRFGRVTSPSAAVAPSPTALVAGPSVGPPMLLAAAHDVAAS